MGSEHLGPKFNIVFNGKKLYKSSSEEPVVEGSRDLSETSVGYYVSCVVKWGFK